MSKALDMSNNNKEEIMTIFDVVGEYDRDELRTRPEGRYLTVEAFEDSDQQEVGVFMESIIGTGKLTRAIHVSLHKDVVEQGQAENPQRFTNLYLVNPRNAGDGVYNGILNGKTFDMVPDQDFTLVVFNDEGVVERELFLNSNDVELAMWWPNNETTVDAVFVPKGERRIWNRLVKAGPTHQPVTLDRAKYFMDKLHEIPIGFGSVEQVIRWFTSSLKMQPAEMLHAAGIFGINVFQIKSEELIDMAVQADKAFKRLSTLFRVGTPINEIVDDKVVFYMVDANEDDPNFILDPAFAEINSLKKDWEEELNMSTLYNMNLLHHDGCIFVNPDYLDEMEGMIDNRYKRQEFADAKRKSAIKKFRKALTFQLRATGAGLVDQNGNVIGLEGHLKTHIMVADGPVARWMQSKNITFFGTGEAYKQDMAVRTEKLALLVQTKAPKFDILQSVQFYTTIDAIEQGAAYNRPLVEALQRRLDEIVSSGADKLQEFADAMAGEAEDDEDMSDLGMIRKEYNELLATYGISGLPVIDSPAATFGVLNNMLQKFRFATLNKDKNADMTNKGFGRHLAYPIPGVRLQVFPRAFMVAGGHSVPDIAAHEIYFHSVLDNDQIQVAVVNDETWKDVYDLTGGPDLDDFWGLTAVYNEDGELCVIVQRNPAMYGEYLILEPHMESLDQFYEQVVDSFGGDIPRINSHLLPTPVNSIYINGNKVEPLTLIEAYDQFIAPATGRPKSNLLNEFDKIDEQKRLMRTYVQMIILAGARLLNKAHLDGLTTGDHDTHWKRMDTRMLFQANPAEVEQYNEDMGEWHRIGRSMGDPQPRKPRGVIEGLIIGQIQSINTKPEQDRYKDVHAVIDFSKGNPWPTIREGDTGSKTKVLDYGPYIGKVLVENAKAQVAVSNKKYNGGITLMRNKLERMLESSFRLVLERMYDDYGIRLVGDPGKKRYNANRSPSTNDMATSQHNLRVMTYPTKGFMKLFFPEQNWQNIRAHNQWVGYRTALRIKVVGLEDTVLGQVVLNTSVSEMLPAASMVRVLYGEFYKKNMSKRDNDGPNRTMASREAWLKALETVQIPMSNMEDVNKFVLALLYVLRATPNVARHNGIFNIDENLDAGYGKPHNVATEGRLYSSILINWGSERINLVRSAFEYMNQVFESRSVDGEIPMGEDAREVELVTYRGSDLMADVFLFKPETELVCQNCGTVYPVREDKFVDTWRKFVAAGKICKNCRS